MTNVICLALIIFFESGNQSNVTKDLVSIVAHNRAQMEGKSICESMVYRGNYSFQHDGKNENINLTNVKVKEKWKDSLKIAKATVKRKRQKFKFIYFNNCYRGVAGRKFLTPVKLKKSEDLCFY